MESNKLIPFHLAIPVNELNETAGFYKDVLGCKEGRSSDKWMDLNFFGHQLVLHISGDKRNEKVNGINPVDGHNVPVPHFGVVLSIDDWHILEKKLISANYKFLIEPYIRFKGEPGEQATMFLYDPSGNALEFKAFRDIGMLFAK
ncbi:MAG: VOC family protein [Ignavibacteria bacterium]|nr:VOC family protein [Ignavibacteria bacterium]